MITRSYFQNSYFVFHRGIQTPRNNKSTRPTASCFHLLGVWIPRWNTRSRFGNSTWRLSPGLLQQWVLRLTRYGCSQWLLFRFRFSVCILYPLCSLQCIFCIRSTVCCLHFVLTGIRGTNTVYFWLQLFAQHTIYHKIHVCELIRHFRSFPR